MLKHSIVASERVYSVKMRTVEKVLVTQPFSLNRTKMRYRLSCLPNQLDSCHIYKLTQLRPRLHASPITAPINHLYRASLASGTSPRSSMASPKMYLCANCDDSNAAKYRAGWKLRSGGYAVLCDTCASAYEEGIFCYIFHENSDGWRDCNICEKPVHCGCIASYDAFIMLDLGGIMCTECSKTIPNTEPNRCPSSSGSSNGALLLEKLKHSGDCEECDDTSGISRGAAQIKQHDQALPPHPQLEEQFPANSNNDADITINHGEAPGGQYCQALPPHPQLRESHANSNNSADSYGDDHSFIGKPRGDMNEIKVKPRNMLKTIEHDLQQISRNLNSVVMPLFKKTLSVSDANLKLARLVIPKKCAQAFFPKISEQHGLPIKIYDTRGIGWEFQFCFWSNAQNKMYILKGMRDYMLTTQWQEGDIVTFYRTEPEGKMIMGLKKSSVKKSSAIISFSEESAIRG